MSRFEKWNLWISSLVVGASGVALLWTKYFVQADDPWAVINHPWQPWFLKAHIISAPFLLFALGLVTRRHIWWHYRTGVRQGRRSGSSTALLTGPLVLTGYLIQIVTRSEWLELLAVSHIVFGFAYLLCFGLHQWVFARDGGKQRSYPVPPPPADPAAARATELRADPQPVPHSEPARVGGLSASGRPEAASN